MAKTKADVANLIKKEKIVFIDYRFTDTLGVCHHITVPTSKNKDDINGLLANIVSFDGSSIPGWRSIENSDMQLRPDFSTAIIDPFIDEPTLVLFCDVLLPDCRNYELCPRGIANSAIAYLKKTGIGTDALLGPEPEFFIFDSVQWKNRINEVSYCIHSEEGAWSSALDYEGFNSGHRPNIKGGYFPVSPTDSMIDIRNEICRKLDSVGIVAEVHHHEVATGGQCEIGTRFASLVSCGDHSQIFKYIVRNVAHQFGKTATFMPKPLQGDNGSGMHVHQSIVKNGKNLFIGKGYGGLSQTALWYVGGILKNARALNAIVNPSTNSYKRLLPGFEAPISLAYSAHNRSAAIRIPYSDDCARRVETRFPDPLANPYLCFSALLLAGLDGIKNKIEPGEPSDYNLYAQRRATDRDPTKLLCGSLSEALKELDSGRDFLTKTGVFSDVAIDSFLALKWGEVNAVRQAPHPIEFDRYYSW